MFRSVPKLSVLVLALLVLAPAAAPLAQGKPAIDAAAIVEDLASTATAALPPPLAPKHGRDAPAWDTPGRVVVGFHADALSQASRVEKLAQQHGGKLLRVDAKLDFAVVQVPPAFEDLFTKSARALPAVSYAHRDSVIRASFTPNDPRYADQWGPAAIGMPAAWDATLGSHDVVVAVIDTGVDHTHPDLAANYCVSGPDYNNADNDPQDDFGHGTHVAGTIAAVLDNAEGVAGMSNACLMAVKVLDAGGSGSFADAASGIVWAADNGADIISMSFGGCPGCDPGEPMTSAMTYAHDHGVLLVAAAGNEYCAPVSYPAAYPEALAVAALRAPGNETSSFSSCGDKVELAAPGQDIVSTAITSGPLSDPSGYMFLSGTSMATPHVSGVAALVWAAHPELSNEQLRCLLDETAVDIMDAGKDAQTGYGRVDANAALALGACTPQPPLAPHLSGFVTDGAMHVSWSTPAAFGTITGYGIYVDGALFATTDASVHAYDLGGTNGQTYVIQVSATDEAGEGPLSNALSLTPMPPQSLPYADDLESGAAGWTATGQWHLTQDRSSSPSTSFYYGMENGPGLEDNSYDDGQTNSGTLTSPLLDLRNATSGATLSWWDHWAGEGAPYEHPVVQASTDGGGSWATVYESFQQSGEGPHSVDLAPFTGGYASIRFVWDTKDPIANGYEGWYVDDVAVGAAPPPSSCDTPGPDAYGYACSVTGAAFYDITANGTSLPLGDDQVSDPIALPFAFPYYGVSHTDVRVSSNGFLTFANDGNSGCCSGQPMPGANTPNDVIAGYWMDLLPPAGGAIVYGSVTTPQGDAFAVEWANVPSYGTPDAVQTFEVLLFPDGSIEVQFGSVGGSYQQKATGIEDCNGSTGLQFRQGMYALEDFGVRFAAPLVPTGPACQPDQPPVTTIDAPSDGAVVSGVITVTGTASDPDVGDAVENVWVAIDCYGCNELGPQSSWSTELDTTGYANGWHTIFALAWDGQQYGYSTISIDIENEGGGNTPPYVTINEPAQGATVSGVVAVIGNASDADGDAFTLTYAVDGQPCGCGPNYWGAYYEFDWASANVADGWHQLCVTADDAQAQSTQCLDLLVQNGGNYGPTVTIASPQDGENVFGTIGVQGDVSDPEGDLVSLRLFVDGALAYGPATWPTPTAYNIDYDTTTLTDGVHQFCVEAADAASSMMVCVYPNVANANDPGPTSTFGTPHNGDTLAGTVDVSAYVTPSEPCCQQRITFVGYSLDGGPYAPMSNGNGDNWTGAPYFAQLDTRNVSDGAHTLSLVACDPNVCAPGESISVTVQNGQDQAPVAWFTEPTDGATLSGVASLSGYAYDPDGQPVDAVYVSVDGNSWYGMTGAYPWSGSLDTTLFADGTHTLWVAACNAQCGYGQQLTVTFANAPADAAPHVAITSPANGATVSGRIAVQGTASDPDAGDEVVLVQARVDNGSWSDAAGTDSWTLFVDTNALANGIHTVQARAFDGERFSSLATIQVDVRNAHAPSVTIAWPYSGAIVGGVQQVYGNAYDEDGDLASVEVRVDGGAWQPTGGYGTPYSWTRYVDTQLLANGLHDVEARATDAGGLTSPIALVQVLVQNGGAPALAIDAPGDGATVGGRVEVSGRAFAPGGHVQRVEVQFGYWAPWRTAFGTESWSLPVDTTSFGTFTGLPILARAYDGTTWSEPVLVYVDVVNGPDLKIGAEDIKVIRHPIQTDLATAPNVVNEQRTVQVLVHNVGTLATKGSGPNGSYPTMVELVAHTHANTVGFPTDSVVYLGSIELPALAPGATFLAQFDWDTTGFVGDVRLEARLYGPGDLDPTNDHASVTSYVAVGGMGGAYI